MKKRRDIVILGSLLLGAILCSLFVTAACTAPKPHVPDIETTHNVWVIRATRGQTWEKLFSPSKGAKATFIVNIWKNRLKNVPTLTTNLGNLYNEVKKDPGLLFRDLILTKDATLKADMKALCDDGKGLDLGFLDLSKDPGQPKRFMDLADKLIAYPFDYGAHPRHDVGLADKDIPWMFSESADPPEDDDTTGVSDDICKIISQMNSTSEMMLFKLSPEHILDGPDWCCSNTPGAGYRQCFNNGQPAGCTTCSTGSCCLVGLHYCS